MNQPLVSIVVPIYKVPEKYLRQCIESCINQTLHDLEIILVDDGSPDKCGEICDEYAKMDARIKVIHKKNGGLAAARNTGQDAATGITLKFLDGDDYMEPECCKIMYDFFVAKRWKWFCMTVIELILQRRYRFIVLQVRSHQDCLLVMIVENCKLQFLILMLILVQFVHTYLV